MAAGPAAPEATSARAKTGSAHRAAAVLAVWSAKGGVGKTTAAVNLADCSARSGRRTLLWDLDPQGGAGYLFSTTARRKYPGELIIGGERQLAGAIRHTGRASLDLVPSDASYRSLELVLDDLKKPERRLATVLEPVLSDYDLIVLDCPPGTSLLAESVVHGADVVLVPLIPAPLSIRTLEQVDAILRSSARRRTRVLGYFSMVDGRKRLHRELVAQLRAERGDLARTTVPALSAVEQMGEQRAPVHDFAPGGPAAAAFASLWDEVAALAFG